MGRKRKRALARKRINNDFEKEAAARLLRSNAAGCYKVSFNLELSKYIK